MENQRNEKYEDLGFAKIDHDRKQRSGEAEVVFCQGKADERFTRVFWKKTEKCWGQEPQSISTSY